MAEKKMFITDLDGTLFRPDQTLSGTDLETLEALGEKGVVRVAATGRSLFSLERSIKTPLPVDYLIFSTGAGICSYPEPFQNILSAKGLSEEETDFAAACLEALGVDYMIQNPIPDNHFFSYRSFGSDNSDFFTRIKYYKTFCSPLYGSRHVKASQLLAIVPEERGDTVFEKIRKSLGGLSIIRATSPLDGKTTWIEILPVETSKSSAATWLADYLNIRREETVAVGNDYNDEDLLLWARKSFVVNNAPPHLKAKFKTVASNINSGVSEAVRMAF